jgi:chorismate mutase
MIPHQHGNLHPPLEFIIAITFSWTCSIDRVDPSVGVEEIVGFNVIVIVGVIDFRIEGYVTVAFALMVAISLQPIRRSKAPIKNKKFVNMRSFIDSPHSK